LSVLEVHQGGDDVYSAIMGKRWQDILWALVILLLFLAFLYFLWISMHGGTIG